MSKKRDRKAYRTTLESIFKWAINGFARVAKYSNNSPRRKNLLAPYNSVVAKLWKLYQETGDSCLFDAYKLVCASRRLNVPVPFYLTGQESPGARQRREANENLLLAYVVASKLEPKKPYSMIQASLKNEFCRSPNAIPMRILDYLRRLQENKWEMAWGVRDRLEAFKAEGLRPIRRNRKFVSLRPSRLGGNPFTSLSLKEEKFVSELCEALNDRRHQWEDSARSKFE